MAGKRQTKAELERKLTVMHEAYNDLLLRYKYVTFDLEATRRELAAARGDDGGKKEKGEGKGKT